MAVLEVAVDQSITGSARPVVNVFHVQADDGMFVTAVASAVAAQWEAKVLASQHSAVRCERVRVRSLDGISFAEVAVGDLGANQSAGMAPQVALLARKITPGLPRRRYGKFFFAGLTDADVDQGGNINSGTVDAWNTRLAEMITALNTAGCPMVQPYWSTTTVGGSFTDVFEVQSIQAQSKVATVKRRNRK